MQYLVTKLVNDAASLEAFEGRVNEYLADEWKVKSLDFFPYGPGFTCRALLEMDEIIWVAKKDGCAK